MLATRLSALAEITAFTYQGRLTNGGTPATGSFDLQFTPYDAATSGDVVGSPIEKDAVAVAGGLFTVELDFGGSPFTGAEVFLEIGVRAAGGGSFTLLSPRQRLAATPYAIRSLAANDTQYHDTGAGGPGTNLCIAGGVLASCSSSLRYKENVADLGLGLDAVLKLRPVAFDWKANGEHDLGFVAEEVDGIDPFLVTYKDGRLTALLANAVKDQQAEIEELKKIVSSLAACAPPGGPQ